MTRVRVNGVIWSTAEDNILEAAFKTYGHKQWKAIASLLKGKTVKQCKFRWHVRFNPNGNKKFRKLFDIDKLIYQGSLKPSMIRAIQRIMKRAYANTEDNGMFFFIKLKNIEISTLKIRFIQYFSDTYIRFF